VVNTRISNWSSGPAEGSHMPDNDDPVFNLDEEKTIIKPSP